MMLGKRARPPMSRTTSMRALPAEELVTLQESPAVAPPASAAPGASVQRQAEQPQQRSITTANNCKFGAAAATAFMNSDGVNPSGNGRGFLLSSRGSNSSSRPRRNSADFLSMEATHFLRSCTLCKHPIAPGRDIYMYRGDTAYCSIECRQQQVNLDEKKEKCSVRSLRKEAPPAASEAIPNGETAAAA